MISSAHLPLFVLAISQAAQAFKTTPRGTANATTDADNSRGSSSSSRSLPLSAIIGIVIGVMLIFALATCLFAVYFARQKTSPFSEQRYSYREEFDSPKTMVEPWGYVASPGLRGATTRDGAGEASGEYCSRTGEAARFGHIQLSHDPRAACTVVSIRTHLLTNVDNVFTSLEFQALSPLSPQNPHTQEKHPPESLPPAPSAWSETPGSADSTSPRLS
ncbi:hypothetical protein Trco_001169 [Trichoderma cornu-damae]|uniref:Uncharacterized protein n=1 Tax=Trichoderma cornu-damae TaxID=654480 RepID=A0A9P8TZP8_9HYPO|nr:hypothetical protein Trco_001169 [Trichoderma cornu-damae]